MKPLEECTVYYKGYVHDRNIEDVAVELALQQDCDAVKVSELLASLEGHFAFVVLQRDSTLLAVDWARSIPLLFTFRKNRWNIADNGGDLRSVAGLSLSDVNLDQAQVMAMAGFTLADNTLYKNVWSVRPGHFVILHSGTESSTATHYGRFEPWRVDNSLSDEQWQESAKEQLLGLMQRTASTANGRQILLPLSAGLDSRLIASGLKAVGYDNVACFSYGLEGNYEADAARRIAKHLGYPWHFLSSTPRLFRQRRNATTYQSFLSYADALTAVPTEQDATTISELRSKPWVNNDAIIINGQSGDFITGGHVPDILANMPVTSSQKDREDKIFDATVKKHFGLWQSLRTSDRLGMIRELLFDEVRQADAPMHEAALCYSLYEYSEFANRQIKYVVQGQRAYDYYGFQWQLPLWEPDMIRFWQSVPLHLKLGQKLYRDSLLDMNWGGVWQGFPVRSWITPQWIRPLRTVAKVISAPGGKNFWHKMERRFFAYHMDVLTNYGVCSWLEVATGKRDHRNAISWLCKDYLFKHGLDFDGSPLR
ncbi:asparagine synthase-related protein [Aestuariispira ectoiniformans]|uniref:asparagine synthase-related protein n=1 Tax=Aestuariispira ectoiniformans TaxID=2775080 RepID=UPI00223C02CF|nr:asparagine synthetase B family protein [Aestuariispira ectoiniformans]